MTRHLVKFARYVLLYIVILPATPMAAPGNDSIVLGRQHVPVNYADYFEHSEKRVIHRWLQRATDVVGSVYGELPMDYFEISVERGTSLHSPVPWGHIERGDPTRVILVVNPGAGYDKLLADWTVFHELSHLFLPYRGYGDIWFSEGLATYYQNIMQARGGLLDEQQMWQRIAAGLKRGREQDDMAALTLSQVSADMRETRQFMRIHWSGVLYWLTMDIALRTSGKGTLDQALLQLKRCCQHRAMTAQGLARKLDDLTGTDMFTAQFSHYRGSHGVPEYQSLLAKLGIAQINAQATTVRLDEAASWAPIRRSLSDR